MIKTRGSKSRKARIWYSFFERYKRFKEMGLDDFADQMREGAFRFGWSSTHYWTVSRGGCGRYESQGFLYLMDQLNS